MHTGFVFCNSWMLNRAGTKGFMIASDTTSASTSKIAIRPGIYSALPETDAYKLLTADQTIAVHIEFLDHSGQLLFLQAFA
jgi:hypothetical protein